VKWAIDASLSATDRAVLPVCDSGRNRAANGLPSSRGDRPRRHCGMLLQRSRPAAAGRTEIKATAAEVGAAAAVLLASVSTATR
jgi:hypothetical protein